METLKAAAVLWVCIAVLDWGNKKNSIVMAIFLGAFFGLPASLGLPVMFMLLPAVAFLWVLMAYYEIGFLRAFTVLVVLLVVSGGVLASFMEATQGSSSTGGR